MNFYRALPLLSAIACGVVGIYVILRDPRQKSNRTFMQLCLVLACWGLGEYIMRSAATLQAATFGARVAALGWCLTGAAFLDFSFALTLAPARRLNRAMVWSAYTVSLAFLVLTWATPLVFGGFTASESVGYVEIAGPLRLASRLAVLLPTVLSVMVLLTGLRRASSRSRRIALALAAAAALIPVLSGTVTDILLPVLGYNPPVSSMATIPLMVLLVALAVNKYDLLESVSGFLGGSIIDKIRDAVIVVDSEGLVETLNTAAESLLDSAREGLLRKPFDEIFFQPGLLLSRETHGGGRFTGLCVDINRRVIPASVSVETVRRRTGSLAGWVLVVRDLRDELELREAERAAVAAAAEAEAERDRSEVLRTAQERLLRRSSFLQKVIDNIADPLWIKDSELRFVFVNRAYVDLTGITRDQAIGRTESELAMRPEPQAPAGDEGALRSGTVLEDEMRFKAGDGVRIFKRRRVPLVSDSGALQHVVCVLTDLTERKRLSRARLEFLRVAAHELRTPLTSLNLGVEMLALETRGAFSDEQQRSLDMLAVSIDRLTRLAGNLLDLTNIETGLLTLGREPVDLSALIREVAAGFVAACGQKGLYCRAQPGRLARRANADPERISQVLHNLVENALKFTESGGITISAGDPGDGLLEVCVRDTGIGISRDRQAVIFKSFESAGEPDDGRDGAGLGLSITKAIVEAHGGRVWVESAPGKGSSFYFTLEADGRQRNRHDRTL